LKTTINNKVRATYRVSEAAQVRDLLELYATTTDQKSAGIVNRISPSVFANQGGVLTSIPNLGPTGAPVGFSAGSAIGNGISFGMGQQGTAPQFAPAAAPAPTYITVNVPGAKDFFTKETMTVVANSGRAVAAAANDGMTASSARRQSAASILQPNFITG